MNTTTTESTIALIAQAKQKANEIFKAYSGIEEIFITSDFQGFTEKEKAENHADILSDKKIFDFQRDWKLENETPSEDGGKDKGEPNENGEPEPKSDKPTSEDEERTALLAEYEELYGQKANHNIGTEKLKAKIEAKKAEGEN